LKAAGDGLGFMADDEVTDYCDLLIRKGERSEEVRRRLFVHLLGVHTRVRSIILTHLPEASPSLSLFPRLASREGFSPEVSVQEVVPVLPLPPTYEEYLDGLGRRRRHELRRKLRRAASLDGLRVERLTRPGELERGMPLFISLHRESSPEKRSFWQKEGLVGFFMDIARCFSRQGWMELTLLFSGPSLVAALLSFLFRKTVFFYNFAYNQAFSAFNPGTYLFDLSIRKAIDEERTVADFLRGGEKYKFELGARESRIYTLSLHRAG